MIPAWMQPETQEEQQAWRLMCQMKRARCRRLALKLGISNSQLKVALAGLIKAGFVRPEGRWLGAPRVWGECARAAIVERTLGMEPYGMDWSSTQLHVPAIPVINTHIPLRFYTRYPTRKP